MAAPSLGVPRARLGAAWDREGVPAQGRGGKKWAVRSMVMLLMLLSLSNLVFSLSNLVFASAEISLSPQGRVIFCLFHLYHQFLLIIPTQWG